MRGCRGPSLLAAASEVSAFCASTATAGGGFLFPARIFSLKISRRVCLLVDCSPSGVLNTTVLFSNGDLPAASVTSLISVVLSGRQNPWIEIPVQGRNV